jgi:hypothetical protein
MHRPWIFLFALLLVSSLGGASHAQSLLINGGFETGSFLGWSRFQQSGSPGNFHVTNDIKTPFEEWATPGPAVGNFYAVTDSNAPGTDDDAAYSLIQTITIPSNTNFLTVDFQYFVEDWYDATARAGNGTLDFTQAGAAQFARVDLLTASAGAFSVAPGDIVHSFNILTDGQALTHPALGWTSVSQGMLVTPGQSYQLRFASVQNQFSLTFGVDAASATASMIPEPSTIQYLALLLPLLALRKKEQIS